MQYRQAVNPLGDFGEILCRWAWIRMQVRSLKKNLNLVGIVTWPAGIALPRRWCILISSSLCYYCFYFLSFLRVYICAFFFTKLGVVEGVSGPTARAKFHHRGFRNVGPPKSSKYGLFGRSPIYTKSPYFDVLCGLRPTFIKPRWWCGPLGDPPHAKFCKNRIT